MSYTNLTEVQRVEAEECPWCKQPGKEALCFDGLSIEPRKGWYTEQVRCGRCGICGPMVTTVPPVGEAKEQFILFAESSETKGEAIKAWNFFV